MRVTWHQQPAYAAAIRALMPPGQAWDWPDAADVAGAWPPFLLPGSDTWRWPLTLGGELLDSPAYELARVDAEVQPLLDAQIEWHRPKVLSWRLVDYRAVAALSQDDVAEPIRRSFVAGGSAAGQRLWAQPKAVMPVEVARVDPCRPFAAGSAAGERLWGSEARYVLQVRYYAGVARVSALVDALANFRQAHMQLFFVDITGDGGGFLYA